MKNNNRTVLIIRSVSGAGKSFFTDHLCQFMGVAQVSADDYFRDKHGNYNFIPEKIGEAHAQCRERFMEALKEPEAKTIVVNNTNYSETQWSFYEQEAKKVNIPVIFLVIENRHGNVNDKSIPDNVLDRQERAIIESLKLR